MNSDAWNRLTAVTRAYRDSGGVLQFGSVVATMSYDGLGRRIVKTVDNSGDWDCTYNYYYNGQQMVETRNGSDHALTQNVWGLQYVDELVQIMHAPFPGPSNKPNHPFWVLQDANFNVLGVVSRTGRLVERYEYTPYGQRTVFSKGWLAADFADNGNVDVNDLGILADNWGTTSGATLEQGDANGDGAVDVNDLGILADNYGKSVAYADDPLTMYPRLGSYVATPYNPLALCDVGHQGLPWDREYQKYNVRTRIEDPVLAIFYQNDLLEYIDSMNRHEYERSNAVNRLDPLGLDSGAANAARNALRSLHEIHVNHLYYEANNGWLTGLRYLIWNKLNKALWWLDENDYSYGSSTTAVASYMYIINDLVIPSNPSPYTMMHEAIHVYNDWVDKYEDDRQDEGLAYAASGMAKGLESFKMVENTLKETKPDIQKLRRGWQSGWGLIDQVGWPGSCGEKMFNITEEDIRRVESHLGFKVHCSQIADLYNKQPGTKRACVEFLCDPKAKPRNGKIGLVPMKVLHRPYK